MLSTAKYVSARMNVLGNSQVKQGCNVNKRKTIVEGEEGIIERVRFRDFLGSIPVCNMVCGLTDLSEPESMVVQSREELIVWGNLLSVIILAYTGKRPVVIYFITPRLYVHSGNWLILIHTLFIL